MDHDPLDSDGRPLRDLTENVGVTISLLEALKRRGGGRILFSSSGGTVYGRLRTIPVPENHPLDPISAYGVSKVTAEKYLQYYHTAYGIDASVARISNPFGAGQNPARPQGAVTTFVHRALGGQPIEIWGDGEVVRDFVHIADVADALIALANARLGTFLRCRFTISAAALVPVSTTSSMQSSSRSEAH